MKYRKQKVVRSTQKVAPAKRSRVLPGYTLIEMMVVIAIALITLTAVTTAIFLFYRSNTKALNQGYALQSARQGIQRMVRDIRSIEYGADGSYPVNTIAPYSFTFYTDTNKDGITEKVRYFLSGTNLMRGITFASGVPPVYPPNAEQDSVLSDHVQNAAENIPLFHFYDASSTELTTLSITDPVAYVTVTVVVNANESTASTSDYTLRSTAAIRNVSQF